MRKMPTNPSRVASPATPGLAPAKVKLIHVARRQLALSEDDYRAILAIHGGATSAAELSSGGFAAVMAQFERLGFKSTSSRRPLAVRAGMASPGQASMILQLWSECTVGAGTDASLGRWLEGKFGVSSLRFVNQALAPKVIAGLRSMQRNLGRRQAAMGDPPNAA